MRYNERRREKIYLPSQQFSCILIKYRYIGDHVVILCFVVVVIVVFIVVDREEAAEKDGGWTGVVRSY